MAPEQQLHDLAERRARERDVVERPADQRPVRGEEPGVVEAQQEVGVPDGVGGRLEQPDAVEHGRGRDVAGLVEQIVGVDAT